MLKFIKDIVLSVLINSLILWWLSFYQFWLSIEANSDPIQAFLILGLIFWIVNFWLKKILHIVAFPLKVLTLGLFSIVINIGVLYFFEWFVNTNYSQLAQVSLSPEWIKVLILSVVISWAYALLSKILK